MLSSIETSVKDGGKKWNIRPYGQLVSDVDTDKALKSFDEALARQLAIVLADESGSSDPNQFISKAQSLINEDKQASAKGDILNDSAAHIFQYSTPSVSDASIGGNEAINPHAAFNEDDDIVHTVLKDQGGRSFGMGRCYSEIYDSKQQIVYLTMGVPKYRDLGEYTSNAVDSDMAKLNEEGHAQGGIWGTLGAMFGAAAGAIGLAVQLPWLGAEWLSSIADKSKEDHVTEYFLFRESMPLYLRYVNTMLSHIAVGMGLFGQGSSSATGSSGNGANITSIQQMKLRDKQLPAILEDGPDIFKIITKRAKRLGISTGNSDDLLQNAGKGLDKNQDAKNSKEGDPGYKFSGWTNLVKEAFSALKIAGMAEGAFIGFRIERSDHANESFGNDLQESQLAARLNNEVSAARQRNMGEMSGEGFQAWARRAFSNVNAFFDRLTKGTSDPTSLFDYFAAGNGYFDLPKQWRNASGATRSYTFQMKLRARTGGDNVSIFQSIMIPLSCLLCAALPRQVGNTAYTSPFLVRAYCKGMFAVPAGIITGIQISRGSSEFGWALNRLPTVVDVSFTIEDLSPIIFLSLAGNGVFQQAFSNNTKLHEYLDTLTGIGLKERYFWKGRFKRRLQAVMLSQRNTTFSPTYWGYLAGDSSIVRTLMTFTRWKNSKVSNN